MYGDSTHNEGSSEQWRRRIIALDNSNLHILRTNFRCESAVSREISIDILSSNSDTPIKWTRTSSHTLHLHRSTSLDIHLKFDARDDLVEWLSRLQTELESSSPTTVTTTQSHPIQGNWIIDFFFSRHHFEIGSLFSQQQPRGPISADTITYLDPLEGWLKKSSYGKRALSWGLRPELCGL